MTTDNPLNTPVTAEGAPSEPEQPEKAVTFSFGIILVRTKRLLNFLDKLAKYKIFSDLGWVYLVITFVSGAIMLWLMLYQTWIITTGSLVFRCAVGAATPAQCHASNITYVSGPSPQTYLLLPGINPVIPILYGIIGIVVAVVVHEGTHGVIARSFKMAVKSTGLVFFLIVPIGAFVEIDEKVMQNAKFRQTGRVLAGGPGSNIIVALVALALLLLLLGGLAPVQYNGVDIGGVVQGSPAYNLYTAHEITPGDLIVAVNGTIVHSVNDLHDYMLRTLPNETLVVSIDHGGKVSNYNITLAANKINSTTTIGLIGVTQAESNSDLLNIRGNYTSAFFRQPLYYLIVPGISSQADSVVPFSNDLHTLYTSSTLGSLWYPVALTLFWIWFINVNLAFFNAIPLYPLDGGQAMLNFFSHFGRKGVENRAKLLTTIISIAMLIIILTYLFLPRLLGVITFP